MKKFFVAFLAAVAFLASLLVVSSAQAGGGPAPVQMEGMLVDFGVYWVKHDPGSKVVDVYGYSARTGSVGVDDSCRLRATDNGIANSWTFDWMSGIGRTAADEYGVMVCPSGSFCAGKVFGVNGDTGDITHCNIAGDGLTASSCAVVPTFKTGATLSIGGGQLLASGWGSNAQVFSVNYITGASTPMPACSATLKSTGAAGLPTNGFLYLLSNRSGTLGAMDLWRITWTGTDCSGSATNLNSLSGYGNANTALSETPGAVDPLTGDMYYTKNSSGVAFRMKLAPTCGDGFISGLDEIGGEQCDAMSASPLNAQTCLTVGMGFTGGTLGCNAITCKFDTSACTSPAVCGNTIKEAGEACDSPDFGGSTCASIKGAGWTGSLVCTGSCSTIDSSGCSPPPPVCGNGVKQVSEACDSPDFGGKTCATEMGAGYTGSLTCTACTTIGTGGCMAPLVCGNGIKEGAESCDGVDMGGATCASAMGAGYIGSLTCTGGCVFNTAACTKCGNAALDGGEVCDGSLFGGKTCASEMGAGWTGSLSCNGSCSMISTAGCSSPAPFCGDTSCNGGETCSTCPSDCGMCCGNGTINAGEACDGVALGGATCTSVLGAGYSGSVSCKVDCTFNTSSCMAPVTCGNSVLDAGELCDGTKFGTHTCVTEKGEGYTGSLTCTSMCVIDNSGCTAPPWGVKVLSGGCTVTGIDPLNGAINTVAGKCQFSFTPKEGATANNFEIDADSVKVIPFTIAKLPTRSAFTIPKGIVWTEPDSKGNKKQFGYGAGVVMGDEGTGFVFDTKTNYPIVHFYDADKTICFGKDSYENRMTEIDVGNGVGCLNAGWHVEINVETKSVTKAPWKDGAGGDGGAGDGGTDAGSGGSDAGSGGDAGTGSETPTGGGGDTGGCSCAIPGQEGFPPLSGTAILALFALMIRLGRRRARSAS